ncbi:hypothetical protein [Rhodopirellula sp. MGV]|uniref:hypothetical protein n=1 Tax=Rhodopirellula sp. MGV TaxID=2023130 RepID=UPI000B965AEF|nr:hypothetical protein [Rhodopirellula sp. MGV]OYP36449.1 hypothetical protein CGZ80_09100 [Rhodopirellula sp. MGV]PNY36876.1 hypothetical protein C2E31_11010 [Rhodopirellula baltica]
MNLLFSIASTSIECDNTRNSIRLSVEDLVRGSSAVSLRENGPCLCLEVEASDLGCESSMDSDDLLELLKRLAEVSQGLDLRWQIGHELDARMGEFDGSGIRSDLAIELSTAFTVAQSLAGIIVDGEFADEYEDDDDGSDSPRDFVNLQNDDEWNSLTAFEETFQRFPEMD